MVDKVEMNSFTSSSDARFDQSKTFVVWVWSCLPMLLVTALFSLAIGESYMQVTFLPSLFHQFDAEIGYTYIPNQKSITWQGNYSIPSPPIGINSDGHRGSETDWSKKVILALGSSEVMGPGIEDHQTWAVNLEKKLRAESDDEGIEVVNTGIAGHGPFHHMVIFQRILADQKTAIDTAIIRVSVGDRYFRRPKRALPKSSLHKFLRDHTVFIRHLITRLNAQIRIFKRSFIPFPLRKKNDTAHTRTLQMAEKMWSENKSYWNESIGNARQQQTKILFLVINPTDSAGETYMATQLSELCEILNYGSVLELGSERFGLETLSEKERQRVFERDFTLGYDPHANPKQHQIIAESLKEFLMEEQER